MEGRRKTVNLDQPGPRPAGFQRRFIVSISSIGANSYYTGQLSAMENRRDPAEIFNKTDGDGSGSLDSTEFESLISKLSEATGQELDAEEMFTTYDADGNGVLSETETASALEANRPQGPPSPPPPPMAGMTGPPPDLSQIASDADEDGSIDAAEAQNLIDIINKATGNDLDVEELIATYDEDEDGVLSEDETLAALEANRPEGPPPPGGLADTSPAMVAGIENYLKIAALAEDSSSALTDNNSQA
jgi:Ca2+-binding EF-hand superfamily protein